MYQFNVLGDFRGTFIAPQPTVVLLQKLLAFQWTQAYFLYCLVTLQNILALQCWNSSVVWLFLLVKLAPLVRCPWSFSRSRLMARRPNLVAAAVLLRYLAWASARLIQATKDMFDVLTNII
jgi:hypothetical protein